MGALAVKRVKRVKDSHDKSYAHDQGPGHFVWHWEHIEVSRRIGRPYATHAVPQGNHVDQEAKEKDGRSAQWCDIDQAILPELTSYRPVEWPGGGHEGGRDALRAERGLRHGIRWSIHTAAPFVSPA